MRVLLALLLVLGAWSSGALAEDAPTRNLAVAAAPVASVPPRTVHDILAALDSHPVDAASLDEARRTLAAIPPENAGNAALAEFHFKRARAALELGLVGKQIEALREVIRLGGGPQPFRAWGELAGAEFQGGNFRNVIEARQKAIEITPQNMSGFVLAMHAMQADSFRRIGDFDAAERHVREAEGLLAFLKRSKNWDYYQYNWQGFVEDAIGRIAYARGRYGEAEARFRRALELSEKDLPLNLERLKLNLPNNPPQVVLEGHRDAREAWLASALRAQGRMQEAEVHARNVAYRAIERRGQESLHANVMMQQLVQVLEEQNRPAEALLLIERVQRNLDKLGVPPTSYTQVLYRRLKASALTGARRWAEAIAEYEAMRAALAADPQLIETLGAPSFGWIRALVATRRLDQALPLAEKMARQMREQMGEGAYDAAEARGYHGAVLAAAGRDAEALDALRDSMRVLVPMAAERTDRAGWHFQRLTFIVESYLAVLARVRGTPLERQRGIDAAAEAFLVADALRGQSIQQAMSASAARAAAATPELADLARRQQDARQERDALYKILADLMSRPADQVLPAVIGSMRARAEEFDRQQRALQEQIVGRFPEYADLAFPRPASIAAIRAVLRPGEALISVLPTEKQVFVWAIPAEGKPVFAASALTRAQVNQHVDKLRAALDPKVLGIDSLPAFDGAVAHKLFVELLAPVREGWRGSHHLIVAAGGALSRLPFAVLLSAPPPAPAVAALPYAGYRDWPWLVKDVAISQLPAAAALVTLRRMKAGAPDRLAFAGFGDPDFSGSGAPAVPATRGVRAVAWPSDLRARAQRGEAAEWMDYARIAALPDTREEILALARSLGADPKRDVFLGAEASRKQVFGVDLSRRRVVAFATHGLLAGEFPGVDQPALALANPGGGKHGLLTLDDILALKLDADWVVLSACNTAGGDGEGAEAVSGLGRGFFYAGSRSLLVTHWPVESVSAKRLVVGIFEGIAADGALTRAEALRRSMLAVMRGQEDGARFSYAHPLFWAPYALVGDGGN